MCAARRFAALGSPFFSFFSAAAVTATVLVRLGPVQSWGVKYDLMAVDGRPVFFIDSAYCMSVLLREPGQYEDTFREDYHSSLIASRVFSLIMQDPSQSTKTILDRVRLAFLPFFPFPLLTTARPI